MKKNERAKISKKVFSENGPFASKKGKFEKLLNNISFYMMRYEEILLNHYENTIDPKDRRWPRGKARDAMSQDVVVQKLTEMQKSISEHVRKLNQYADMEYQIQEATRQAKNELMLSNDEWAEIPDHIQSKLVSYMLFKQANN